MTEYVPEKFEGYLDGKVKKGELAPDTAKLVLAAVQPAAIAAAQPASLAAEPRSPYLPSGSRKE